jgi:tetratricopeptide (TPR) repeat protein
LRGICQVKLANYKRAVMEFSEAIAINPHHAKVFIGKAMYLRQGFYYRGVCRLHEKDSRGVMDISRALKFDATFFEAYIARAVHFDMQGDYTRAIVDCNEALRIEPKTLRGYLLRGVVKSKLNQYLQAIPDFTEAISLDPVCTAIMG